MSALEQEVKTYNENLPVLLQHIGRFVLIKGSEIEGYFDTYGDALSAGYAKYEPGEFLVRRIAPAEQVSYFSRGLSFACRA